MWLGNLSMEDMAQYLNRNLSVSTLKSPDLVTELVIRYS